MSRQDTLRYDLGLLFAVLVWGVNFAVIKAALAVMPPHALNLFRFLVSAVVLGGLYAVLQRRDGAPLAAPLRTHRWPLIGLGLLGFFLYQLCFIVGVDHTTAGSAALIMASAPLWTALIGHLRGYEFLTAGAWVGLLGSLAGAAVVVVGGARAIDFSDATFVGNVLMTVAALCWGAYTAFSKPLSRAVRPTGITFYGLLVALPLLIAVGLTEMDAVVWAEVDAWVWGAILFSGGLSTGLAVAIWNGAVKNVGASQTAVFGNLVPVVGLVSGVLFLGESVTAAQGAGGALILGGLVLMRRARRPAPAVTPP
ncbi:MAG: DMT family transporter [Rhodothermales bacterium]|nr:DMT family transporter [Rhodothermales bacterium]